VLLDLNMPGAYGFSGLVLLRGQYPQIPVVMVSAQEEADVVVRYEITENKTNRPVASVKFVEADCPAPAAAKKKK
jgi:CheY-like chemotaxis protein